MTQKQVVQILLRGVPSDDDPRERWDEYYEARREAERLAEESAKRIQELLAS